MKKYKLFGLTGQSGAGKSTVAQTFLDLGAVVIGADEIVAQLYSENSPCVKTIAACFGEEVLKSDGTPDRKKLAELAFSSAENTALLGKIVHPFVTAELFERLRGKEGIVIYDAPQLFESGADIICDKIIAVTADENIRIKRIIQRDGLTEAEAQSRVKAQLDEEFFKSRADYVIENNGDTKSLIQTVSDSFLVISAIEVV